MSKWLNISALELSQGDVWACAKCGTVRFGHTFRPCVICVSKKSIEVSTSGPYVVSDPNASASPPGMPGHFASETNYGRPGR